LPHIHPAIGFANEKMWLYLTKYLVMIEPNLDMEEFLELIPTKNDDAPEMVWNGIITDVKTINGLLWVERHYSDYLFLN
jgi:ADP-ribose pyrophosphatase